MFYINKQCCFIILIQLVVTTVSSNTFTSSETLTMNVVFMTSSNESNGKLGGRLF